MATEACETAEAPAPAKKRRWEPYVVRRRVRLAGVTRDGIILLVTKSFTRGGREDAYYPAIDTVTGAVLCSCPDFEYRHARHDPTVATPHHMCKHLRRGLAYLCRLGLNL